MTSNVVALPVTARAVLSPGNEPEGAGGLSASRVASGLARNAPWPRRQLPPRGSSHARGSQLAQKERPGELRCAVSRRADSGPSRT